MRFNIMELEMQERHRLNEAKKMKGRLNEWGQADDDLEQSVGYHGNGIDMELITELQRIFDEKIKSNSVNKEDNGISMAVSSVSSRIVHDEGPRAKDSVCRAVENYYKKNWAGAQCAKIERGGTIYYTLKLQK